MSSQMSPVEGRASSTLVKLLVSTTELVFPFSRLQTLEQRVIGGEQAQNKDLKEKHKRWKKYADEQRLQLVAALQESNEDSSEQALLNVYDSIQEEVQAKSKMLEKLRQKVTEQLLPPPHPHFLPYRV